MAEAVIVGDARTPTARLVGVGEAAGPDAALGGGGPGEALILDSLDGG